MSKRDPYRVLGVHPAAADDVIKAAWRARMQACHPDRAAVDGPQAVAAAEAETKVVNEAYDEIKRRRARGERAGPTQQGPGSSGPPQSGRARRRGSPRPAAGQRVRRRPIQPEVPINARDGLRRAEVAVSYADTLCGRWRRHAASIRAARKQALAAADSAEAAAQKAELGRRAAVAERDILDAGVDGVARRVTAGLQQVADQAEQAADKAARIAERVERGAARKGDGRRVHAAVGEVVRLAELARGTDLDASGLGGDVQRLHATLAERAERAERAARGADPQVRFANAAAKRGRDALNQARRASQSIRQAVKGAGEAVERATVAAATAAGLCDVDLRQARDDADRFLARRAVTEAARHREAAERLTRDQARVVEAIERVPERMQEIRGCSTRAAEAAQRARADRDIAYAAVEEIRRLAGALPAAVLARAERAAAAALSRAEAAAERVAHHEQAREDFAEGPG